MTNTAFKNILKKYTPTFIVDNLILDAIYGGIANSLLTVYDTIVGLRDADWTGKGLIKNALLNHIIFREDDSEASIRTKLINRFTRHPLVGSEDQILADVKEITGDQTATIVFFGSNNCGLIVDVTYIGIDLQAIIDVNKLIQINLTRSELAYNDIGLVQPKIRGELVPIDVEIIYNITEG